MAVRLAEKKFLRIFLKGIPVFLFVLAIGLFPYIYTLKHEFEAARKVKHELHAEILIGTDGQGEPTFEFSSLEEYLREKIPGNPVIRIPRPSKEPNVVEILAEISNAELESILQPHFEQEERRKQRLNKKVDEEIKIRVNLLNSAKKEIDELLNRPAIENQASSESIVIIPGLLQEIAMLDAQMSTFESSDVNFISEDVSGGSVWTIWRTISAIIGSLGVIYFAAISGLAFGYILDRRA